MADKKKNRVKAEQLYIALIWKYQLGSKKKKKKWSNINNTEHRLETGKKLHITITCIKSKELTRSLVSGCEVDEEALVAELNATAKPEDLNR